MRKLWKQFEAWVIAFKNSVATDIFTTARIKITIFYLLMGFFIFAVAGYFVYAHILSIVQATIATISQLLQKNVAVNRGLATSIILQSMNQEVQNMDLAVGVWVALTILISAYVLAGITLHPIR